VVDTWDEVGLVLGFCCAMTVKARAKQVVKGRVQQMKQLEKLRGLKGSQDRMVMHSWCCSGSQYRARFIRGLFQWRSPLRRAQRGLRHATTITASQQASHFHPLHWNSPTSINPHIQRKTPGTHNVVVPAYAPASGDGLRWLQL